FKVNNWLKTRTELVGSFITKKRTRGVESYWSNANTRLPHTYAVLLPIDRISDFDSLANPKIVDGEYIMGGSKLYGDENLYADLAFAGDEFSMNRFVQFNTGADIDLNVITKGLTAKVYATAGYNNSFTEFFNNTYAVYVPKDSTVSTENNLFAVGDALGADEESTKRTVNDNGLFFYRDIKSYATLNYDKSFGDHEVSALYLAYLSSYTIKDEWQSYKRLRTGAHLNYAFKKKYALEAAMLWQGSDKLSTDNQWATSPSIGAGWILSEEDFLNNVNSINYLKLHASYGVMLNDNFYNDIYDGYFLHENIYQENGGFGYGNTGGTTQGSNTARRRPYRASQLGFQKRNEFVLGMESYLFNNTTWFQVAYFNSLHKDLVSSVYNGTPAVMGLTAPSYQNYEARRDYGVELGAKYTNNIGDFTYSLGVNYMYTDGKYVTVDEPNYVQEGIDDHLKRKGTSTRSLWGLEADGLYTSDDFEDDGVTLNSDLPQPTWTRVQPGDIKYVDYNNDGFIDDDDNHIIGNSSNKHYFGFVIDLRYKNWSLFTTANAQMGGMWYTKSAYYWFKGSNAKYSEIAENAFDIDNQDANAAYPRLTLGNGTHNYRNSSFWTFSTSYFNLNAVQLAYNVKSGVPAIGLKEVKIFGRGSNLLYVAKDKEIMRLRYKFAPQSWNTALGIIATF
ncbi:MAG: hypothetical protein MI922_08785, partial [Bacteroidales bacterium]|nr:hypothetical protein [Bacteroidales bacterium]